MIEGFSAHENLSQETRSTITVQKILPQDGLRLEGVKVLIVDDSQDNQILVSHILILAGATVDVVSNDQEAIERIHKDHYDVILMDLQMPVMDGYEATVELRKTGFRGKIVALSAHALNDEKQRCLESGFNDHLTKPINRKVLIERVDLFSKKSNSQSA